MPPQNNSQNPNGPYGPQQQPVPQSGTLPPPSTPLQRQAMPPLQPLRPTQAPASQNPAYGPTSQAANDQSSSSPYDFFLEQQGANKAQGAKSGSGFRTILIFSAVFMVLLGIAAFALSASRGSKDKSPGLTTLALTQQEIIHSSEEAIVDTESQSTKNFAATAKTTTTSAQQELLEYIKKQGASVDPKVLNTHTNAQVEKALEAAKSAGTYDSTFRTSLEALLGNYILSMQQIHDKSAVTSERTLLEKDIASAKLLLQMLGQ